MSTQTQAAHYLANFRNQSGQRISDSATPHERHTRQIEQAIALHDQAKVLLHQSVYDAHQAGLSWSDIGRLLGVTRQSASEMYRKPPPAAWHHH